MQHSMALLTPLVQSSRRRLVWTTLALLALAACGGAEDTASNGTAGTVNQLLSKPGAGTAAQVSATAARTAPEPAPPMPAALSPDGERPLLEAIARSYPFRKQIETKEQTGQVRALEAARIEANLDQAKLDLAGIKRNLATLSAGGPPTYALIHSVASNGSLNAWIVLPDGGVVAGATSVPYAGLGTLQGGLGVDRIAETRGPQLKGQEKQRLDADADADAATDTERGAGKRDNSPEAIMKRRETLAEAAATLLPGDIRQVLAAGEGRLLVVPVSDTGTAPYAALPIRNQDDFAARRWSFVVMQDLNVLAGDGSGFDMSQVDLSKSVVVGDPDDMRDVRYSFPALPGASVDVVYVDEMFARPLRSAPGFALLRRVAGHAPLGARFWEEAKRVAARRVVVKLPRDAVDPAAFAFDEVVIGQAMAYGIHHTGERSLAFAPAAKA